MYINCKQHIMMKVVTERSINSNSPQKKKSNFYEDCGVIKVLTLFIMTLIGFWKVRGTCPPSAVEITHLSNLFMQDHLVTMVTLKQTSMCAEIFPDTSDRKEFQTEGWPAHSFNHSLINRFVDQQRLSSSIRLLKKWISSEMLYILWFFTVGQTKQDI